MEKDKDNKNRNKLIKITIAIIILILLILSMKCCSNQKDSDLKIGGEDIKISENLEIEQMNDYITFPDFFGVYHINAENPYISFNNKPENDVYMRFTITKDDVELAQSDWIEPNKMYQVNAYDFLEAGKYEIVVMIETLDIATSVPCTSLSSSLDVEVVK